MSLKLTGFLLSAFIIGCTSQRGMESELLFIKTSPDNPAQRLEIEFQKGNAYNHPSFAIWTEDIEGNYIETLYVTEYVAKGKFRYGELAPGKWKNEPGDVRRPATLPYWAHKRNVKAPDGLYIPSAETAVPDALTSATPRGNFRLQTATSYLGDKKFKVLIEINQAWDANKYWTNNKFSDDLNYLGSLQPAIVYAGIIDLNNMNGEFYLDPIGHSHPSGATGEIVTDLSTLTTAKEIVHKIIIRTK